MGDNELIMALIGAGGAGALMVIKEIVVWVLTRRKSIAETDKTAAEAEETKGRAADIFTDTSLKLINQMQARIDKLESRVSGLEANTTRLERLLKKALKRIEYLRDGMKLLLKQLEELRVEPEFVPEDWDLED